MICHSPITIKPKWNDDPKHISIKGYSHKNRTYSAPCGVCPNCKQNRIAEWTFRLRKEEEISVSCHFITLTYETQNMEYVFVPYHNRNMGTLSTEHLKNFWKHLRQLEHRAGNKNKIKYYAAGEYGTTSTMRPHYHAIIFNVSDKNNYWKAWGKGIVDISQKPVGAGAMAYCAKYIDKPKHLHSDDPRQKEFSRMSQRLGANYLTPEIIKYHKQDPKGRNYVSYLGGVRQKMPNYYRKKIFTNLERHYQNTLAEALAKEDETYNDTGLEQDRKLYTIKKFNHLTKDRT